MPQVGSTNCTVRILTPQGKELLFQAGGGPAPGQRASLGGLRAVETTKDMQQACGGFHLVFEGLRNDEGRRWDQVIPRRSLVFIRMERDGVPEAEPVDPTVMVGFTDAHRMQEHYGEARPQRSASIRGREISCVLLDATLFYHARLAATPDFGTVTIKRDNLRDLLMALSANPGLVARGDPRTILQTLLDTYLFVGGQDQSGTRPVAVPTLPTTPDRTPPAFPTSTSAPPVTAAQPVEALPPGQGTPLPQHPLITTDLPSMPLATLLVADYAHWSLFDPQAAVIPTAQFPTPVGNLWSYLHIFIDRHFQEFFTRVEFGVSVIHFRAKPFLHQHIASGSRFKVTGLPAGPDTEPTLLTLELDPADIITLELETDTQNVYNFFWVVPRGFTDSHDAVFPNHYALPHVITEPGHPSFVGRYGVRLMRDETPYLDAQIFGKAPVSPGTTPPAPIGLKAQPAGAALWAEKAAGYAAQAGILPAERPWFVALIHQESGFNPNATTTNPGPPVSQDQGIAQFNTLTRPTNVGLVDPFDPDNALASAARYWQQLAGLVGHDPTLIAAAYNVGAQTVINAHGVPSSAAQHVAGVTSYVHLYQQYAGTVPPVSAAQLTPAQQGTQPTAPAPASFAQAQPIIQFQEKWEALLQAWYDMGGELFGGTITVRGHPRWNIGNRLLSEDEQGEWESYIEGVRHTYDMRTGQYLTTLRLTRGWYLSAQAAQQLWAEGRTSVTSVSGGPPILDPQTGAPTTQPIPGGAPAPEAVQIDPATGLPVSAKFPATTPVIGIRPRGSTPAP